MTKNSIVRNKNNANKIIFVILSFLIAGLLVFNFIRITYAYFTDERTKTSPVITTGNVAIAYGLYDANGIEVSSPLYMDDNQLVPGSEIEYTFEIQNQGTLNCYLRIKLDLLIRDGSDWDVNWVDSNSNNIHDYVYIDSNDDPSTTFLCGADGYLYYNVGANANWGKIAPNAIVTIPVKIVIANNFPVNDDAYKNKNFGLRFGLQAMQTANITQDEDDGWYYGTNYNNYIDWPSEE